jgi:nitronate monooxygenase
LRRIAAGGIADARGVIAALALGAEAVQTGTAILTCEESGASRIHREALMQHKAEYTGLTKAFTGRLARGINNRMMSELNQKGAEILPYPLQRILVRDLSIAAEAAGQTDLMPLWAGQSASLSTCTEVSVFLNSLVEEVSEIAGPLTEWCARRREKK